MKYSTCNEHFLLAPERLIHGLGMGMESLLLPRCWGGSCMMVVGMENWERHPEILTLVLCFHGQAHHTMLCTN